MKKQKLPYPEHIFKDASITLKEATKKCWDSDPEKFLDNMEKLLNIKTIVIEDGKLIIEKNDEKK